MIQNQGNFSNGDNVFFTWKEYGREGFAGAYDPFLDIVCEIFRTHIKGDFNDFLTKCEVYELHRKVLNSYYKSGNCKCIEQVLWDEVAYEQERMAKTISLMVKMIAEYKPIVMLINRFQMASRSAMDLVRLLIEEDIPNLGIVLGVKIEDSVKLSFYLMHTRVAIFLGDMLKALDIIEDISRLKVPERETYINYRCSLDLATCYMYLGKLDTAYQHAKVAKEFAQIIGKEEFVFQAELLMLRSQMSGWHNIFFCVTDVKVKSSLIEKLQKYNYRNHLAHVYIYAYDNKPEMVMRAYRSEEALVHFTKGIRIAKEIIVDCNENYR